MCDTIVALPSSTHRGATLFAKNSDRERGEAQCVETRPAQTYSPGSSVKCTYIEIPQAIRTNAVLLCRPHWMWGAEMGANEYGVAIGNEAVFAKILPNRSPALLGMDLVRLALERSEGAAQAVHVITSLLDRYGQGGNCSHEGSSYYDNSFLIADSAEAFVLETMGREWVLDTVQDVRSISNTYTIGTKPKRKSDRIDQHIRHNGWCRESMINYAESISDRTREQSGPARFARSSGLLNAVVGALDTSEMIRVLRDHGETLDGSPLPGKLALKTLCMHATDDEPRGQTVGSLVSELGGVGNLHWVTATAAPCTSIFKPIYVDVSIPRPQTANSEICCPEAIWWRHEAFCAELAKRPDLLKQFAVERDRLESQFRVRMADATRDGTHRIRELAVRQCWLAAEHFESVFVQRLVG